MNFSDYASKLRTHAAVLAMKVPTFDDMAANDDYIHSEEFNVRGQLRKKNESISKRAEPDETSSVSSSWSLLDRPLRHKSHVTIPPKDEQIQPTPLTEAVGQETELKITNPISANTSISSAGSTTTQILPGQSSIASLPWLAVVTNTLEEKRTGDGGDGGDSGGLSSDSSTVDGNDSLDSDSDDDDPILSMIRVSKDRKVKTRRSRRSQSTVPMIQPSQRFLHDARISSIDPTRIEDGLLPAPPASETQTQNSSGSGFRGPFGGLVIDFTKAQLHKFIRRPDLTQTPSNQNGRPPLAGERKNQKSNPVTKPEDEYHQTMSSVLLGEDDLAQLDKLRETSFRNTYASMMKNFVREYQNFGFILFTFILALLVFYFQQTADDVT